MIDVMSPQNWPRRCALFLSPAPEDFALLAALIKEWCGRIDLPPFEPHVTLYTGTFAEPSVLGRAMAVAVEGIAPITLHVQGIGCTGEFYKSLFIDFGDDPFIRAIHERFRAESGVLSGYELHPHLSLVYSDLPLAEKESLAKEVLLPRLDFRFDRVKLVTPGNPDAGWRDTGRWDTLLELDLTGRGRGITSKVVTVN
jgi:putative hydrolase of the HAD superfamily